MTINRAEIIVALQPRARKPELIELAMAFIEPLFVQLDAGYYFDDAQHVSNDEIRDVIRSVTDEEHIYPKPIRHCRQSGNIEFIEESFRGTSFGDEMRYACYKPLRKDGWQHVPIDQFSVGIVALMRHVFRNNVAGRLDVVYRHQPKRVEAIAQSACDNMLALLECYFNLTCEAQGKTLQKYLKPALRLANRALPLNRITHKEHGNWTVLT